MISRLVDVSIAFYGKPMQTIIAIKSLMQHSGHLIDKVYLSFEQVQPHGDWSGLHKVIDYFSRDSISFVVQRPHYFLPPNVSDVERTRHDARYRHSIMYQYALEHTDKAYLCVIHNDMLFHRDMIGPMLSAFERDPDLAGTGAIGQCWSCPASAAWANLCSSTTMDKYKPTQSDVINLHKINKTPRRELDIAVLEEGRVHPLPECRLNEYVAILNIATYRQMSLPVGDIGCYGGGWQGADLGTVWFYQMFNRGYRFKHFVIEDYARHAPFDDSGAGSGAYTKVDRYWAAERLATAYINATYERKVSFGLYVWFNTKMDFIRRKSWLVLIHTYGFVKSRLKLA